MLTDFYNEFTLEENDDIFDNIVFFILIPPP
jgi:hypothetical protein